jgi:hypothetical protein
MGRESVGNHCFKISGKDLYFYGIKQSSVLIYVFVQLYRWVYIYTITKHPKNIDSLMQKKVIGIIFIILATILSLAILGQLPELLRVAFGFFSIFTGKLNADQLGQISGHIIYWLFHFALTFALWRHGVRWANKPVQSSK